MTPSEQAKKHGLPSLSYVVSVSGASKQTLINWHRDKPALFECVLAGCAAMQKNARTEAG